MANLLLDTGDGASPTSRGAGGTRVAREQGAYSYEAGHAAVARLFPGELIVRGTTRRDTDTPPRN